MIKVFWHRCENFGDKLTPYLLDKLGIKYEYVDKGYHLEHYIICGSILSACNEHTIIWGAGLAQEQDIEKPKEICAVRGIYTRDMVHDKDIQCPSIYGDISEFLPLVYHPKLEKKRKVGFIPHVVEYDGNGWDLNKSVEETIDYILTSEKVVTSSLHAFLTAKEYGVDVEIYRSNHVIGQHLKINDVLSYYRIPNSFLNACPIKEMKEKLIKLKSK